MQHPSMTPLFAAWLVLLLAGQLAALLLLNAGPLLGYQHYPEPAQLAGAPGAVLAVLLVQTLAVSLGLWRARLPLGRLLGALPRWSLLLGGAAFVFGSAALSRQPSVYGFELLLASVLQLVQLGNLLLVVSSLPEG